MRPRTFLRNKDFLAGESRRYTLGKLFHSLEGGRLFVWAESGVEFVCLSWYLAFLSTDTVYCGGGIANKEARKSKIVSHDGNVKYGFCHTFPILLPPISSFELIKLEYRKSPLSRSYTM